MQNNLNPENRLDPETEHTNEKETARNSSLEMSPDGLMHTAASQTVPVIFHAEPDPGEYEDAIRPEEPQKEIIQKEEPQEETRKEGPQEEQTQMEETRKEEPREEQIQKEETRKEEPREEQTQMEEIRKEESEKEQIQMEETWKEEPREEQIQKEEPQEEQTQMEEPQEEEKPKVQFYTAEQAEKMLPSDDRDIVNDGRTYAGFCPRLMAYLLDRLILLLPVCILRLILWLITLGGRLSILNQQVFFSFTPAGMLVYAVVTAYFVVFTYITGRTIGKRIMRLKVVSTQDRKPTFLEILYRETFGRFLSFVTLCIGYLMIVIGDEKEALHDYLSDTRVIYR